MDKQYGFALLTKEKYLIYSLNLFHIQLFVSISQSSILINSYQLKYLVGSHMLVSKTMVKVMNIHTVGVGGWANLIS